MTFATVQDVADSLGRPITDPLEVAQVQAWLNRVESRLFRRIPDLAARALVPAYLDAVVGVEVDVVVRRINNPEGKKNERIDDYSYGLNDTAASSDLWPTDLEWSELVPVIATGAFTIRPRFGS